MTRRFRGKRRLDITFQPSSFEFSLLFQLVIHGMPRAGQPPASTLRNRNRITNKTRLRVFRGNVDADPIIPDEDEEKNRLHAASHGVDLEDANVCFAQAIYPHFSLFFEATLFDPTTSR